jgi:hypothetical protein
MTLRTVSQLTASNGVEIDQRRSEGMWKKRGRSLTGRIKENHENPKSVQSVYWLVS